MSARLEPATLAELDAAEQDLLAAIRAGRGPRGRAPFGCAWVADPVDQVRVASPEMAARLVAYVEGRRLQ